MYKTSLILEQRICEKGRKKERQKKKTQREKNMEDLFPFAAICH